MKTITGTNLPQVKPAWFLHGFKEYLKTRMRVAFDQTEHLKQENRKIKMQLLRMESELEYYKDKSETLEKICKRRGEM